MRAFTHPITLVALALWILNDHVFKAAWPGLVTGKLSDVAGMIVTPLVLVAVVGRRWRIACAVGVAVAFAAAKTWLPAHDLYCAAAAAARWPLRAAIAFARGSAPWTEHVMLVRDPTDLVAVPFAGVALWLRS